MGERIADHAVNIAKHALSLNNEPQLELGLDLSNTSKQGSGHADRRTRRLHLRRPRKAQATIERDDEVDSLYDIFYAELIAAMSRDSSLVDRGVQWLFVIKHLERIADYVTNICEQIIYMSRGQAIKHSVW